MDETAREFWRIVARSYDEDELRRLDSLAFGWLLSVASGVWLTSS